MSKEAMKLALEALALRFSEGWHEGIKIDASDIMLLNQAAQALAEQPAQQEPVAWCSQCGHKCPPAQRTWVSLTDEEIDKLDLSSVTVKDAISDARVIEAKLREKNT